MVLLFPSTLDGGGIALGFLRMAVSRIRPRSAAPYVINFYHISQCSTILIIDGGDGVVGLRRRKGSASSVEVMCRARELHAIEGLQ
jgi:hypothetical protein